MTERKKACPAALLAIFVFLSGICLAQRHNIDSILPVLRSEKPDSNRLKHLNELAWEYSCLYISDSAMHYANSALFLGDSLLPYSRDEKSRRAIDKYRARAFNNLGNIYYDLGNYPEALKNHFSSLKIMEKINNKKGKAAALNNIGLVYYYQGNLSEALRNHFSCLGLYRELGDSAGVASSYNNIAIVYGDQGTNDEALKYHTASLELKKAIGDQYGIAASLNNIGRIYYLMGEYPTALENYLASLAMYSEKKENAGMALNYYNIGNIYFKQKKFGDAERSFSKSAELSKLTGYLHNLKHVYAAITELHEAKGDYKSAFESYKIHLLYRDSLDNEESRRQTVQSQMTYDFEKKEAVAQAEHKKELENQYILAEEKSRKQKITLLCMVCGLLLVLFFAGLIFRSLQITRKQKMIIEEQKELVEQQKEQVEHQKILVEEHQKDMIDSIMYARRIQRALLPSEQYISKNLKRLSKRGK
jgi:tetratricopeptide (TPR) repeat protein